MKRLLKKTALFIAILLVLTALSSCTLFQSSETAYIDDVDDDSPLQIYLMFWDSSERAAIEKYNSLLARKKIDGRKIEITEFEYEQIDDMYKQIQTEIMAGKGPDIILIDNHYCYRNDFVKMSAQNAFADMDILAKTSETFDYSDYNEMVMDASVINDKRYMMPVSYFVPYVFTTKEVFEKNNIKIPKKLDFENTLAIISEYEKNNPMDSYNFISYINIDVCSLSDSKVDIESDIFRKYNERSRQLYIEKNNEVISDNYTDGVCKARELLYFKHFMLRDYSQYSCFSSLYNNTNNYYNKNIVFLEMPCNENGITKAHINKAIAINVNSEHKNSAFKFIEYLLSYDFNVNNDFATLPVNIKAYEEYKRKFITETKDDFSRNKLAKVIPSDLADDCINIIENVSTCEFIGQGQTITSHKEIYKSLYNYWMQKIDYDTMIKELKSKLELYYSE